LPGISDRLTLDGVVLARGAAWLALAENVSSSKLDGLWATVLFQAGRESLAAKLWQKEFPAKLEHPTPEQAGWNIWLRKPTCKEIFLFASESTNLPIALPMLAYDVTVNQTGRLLAEVLAELVPSPKDSVRLHNYAPLLAGRTSISGGHLMNGAWPVYGRLHWIKLLAEYPASSMDYTGYVDSLRSVTNALYRKSKPDPDLDASLTGFSEAALLLRLAHTEGVGPLAPASVATARDLLNYGWEMAALQMGARHHFVAHSWGVRSQAEPIFKSVTTELEGVMPFFLKSAEAKTYNYKESLARLQMVDGFFQRVGWNPHPFDTKGSDLDSARLFVKRSWLRPRDFEWQARTLWDAKGVADIPELANALREEGGCHAAVPILNYLVSLGADAQREIPGADDLKLALAETLPQPSNLYVRAVYDRKFKNLENFERAQTIERLYWQNPDSGLEDRVFRNYVVVNALTSAKRFYTQARENLLDPVGFANGMGKTAYMVGYVLNDSAVRKMALEDSRSASYSDMVINIWDAAVRDNLKELEQTAHELVERYEEDKGANSQGRQLLKFLPLVPALRDARNSSRQEALRFFGKSESWIALRWIWIEKFKMPAEDAIALLGGRENDLFRRVLICYLEKDPAKTLEALNAFSASRAYIDEKTALSTYLYYCLRKNLPKRDESDLKPSGVVSTRQAVLAKLKSKGN
jgi:hypothetical protein